jgi:hypothetical protein
VRVPPPTAVIEVGLGRVFGAVVWADDLGADRRGGTSGRTRRACPEGAPRSHEHLDKGGPDAWRPALRIFEHAYGRAPGQAEEAGPIPDSPEAMAAPSWTRLQQLAGLHLVEPLNGHDPPPSMS